MPMNVITSKQKRAYLRMCVCSKFKKKEGGTNVEFSTFSASRSPRRDFAKYVNYAPGASSLQTLTHCLTLKQTFLG